MTPKRTLKLMLRWSVLAMAATALFWGVWYLVNGSVPMVTGLELKVPNYTYKFPFAFSHWWDVPVAGMWVGLIVLMLARIIRSRLASDGRKNNLVGQDFLFDVGLDYGLAFGALAALATFYESVVFGFYVGLVGFIVVGLVVAFMIEVVITVVFVLFATLYFAFRKLKQAILSRSLWTAIGRWLSAK